MTFGIRKKVANIAPFLLYGIIALLPWQARYIFFEAEIQGSPWEYATLSIYMVDVLILLLLLITFYTREGIERRSSKAIVAILFFTIYILLLQALSPFESTASIGLLYFASALFLTISLILVSWDRKKILLGLVLAGVWSAILGMVHFFQGEIQGSIFLGIASQNPYELGVSVIESDGLRLLRSYGSLSHPNMFGGLLVISIISSISLLSKYKDRLKRTLLLATIPILTWSLFITFSRSAFAALIFSLLISGMLIYYKSGYVERIHFLKSLAVIMLTLALAMTIFSDEVISRFNGNRLETKSIQERVDAIPIAKELFFTNPVFGTGLNTYTEAAARADDFSKAAWAYQPVHNVDLLLLVELGVVGMIVLLILLVLYIKDFFSINLNTDRIYILGMIVALSVISIFDHYLISSHFGLLLTVVVFSLAIQKHKTQS